MRVPLCRDYVCADMSICAVCEKPMKKHKLMQIVSAWRLNPKINVHADTIIHGKQLVGACVPCWEKHKQSKEK